MSTLTDTADNRGQHRPHSGKAPTGAFNGRQLWAGLPGAFRKLDPRDMWHNPVMFIVEVGAALTTILAIAEPFLGQQKSGGTVTTIAFTWSIAVWLWLTVLFATLAESVAEGRGKAQAASLRKTRTTTVANRVPDYDPQTDAAATSTAVAQVASADLRLGDVVVVTAGELIPGDGDIVWGIASVDESAITGESAPVVRESGGDRSA
ncbi:potassium-transporting ATPase subunit B, partial [Kitasatospora herbaricolor]